jgi:hypothetical protein
MSITTERDDPGLRKILPSGMQESYLVLSEEERAKGFVMPVYRTYRHMKCGTDTTMGQAIAETYARQPTFYGGTYCCHCGTHFPLRTSEGPQFFWVEKDGNRSAIPVGATPEEAAAILESTKGEREAKEREAAEARYQSLSQRITDLLAELPPAHLCPTCGMAMIHSRLRGYECLRGCQ